MKRRQKAVYLVATLFAIMIAIYVAAPVILVSQLSDEDIDWDGNIAGLQAKPSGWPARFILLRGGACVPQLIQALDDDSRFAAAHVLLSYLTQESRSVSGGEWDSLHVDLDANGRTEIPAHQRPRLKQLWHDRLKNA
jgi:hypothetical protein